MAKGDPIYAGLARKLYEQDGSYFKTNEHGFDDGQRTFWCKPSDADSLRPQRGAADSRFRTMFISDVVERDHDGVITEFICSYRGLKLASSTKKPKVLPDCDTQLFAVPALAGSDKNTLMVPVPQPQCAIIYPTTLLPTYTGIGGSVIDATGLLPAPPAFMFSYTPDPDSPPTLNIVTGWVLAGRTWEEAAPGARCWEVTERYVYYYNIAA